MPGICEFIERRDLLTDAKEQSETSPGHSEVFLIDFELSQKIGSDLKSEINIDDIADGPT